MIPVAYFLYSNQAQFLSLSHSLPAPPTHTHTHTHSGMEKERNGRLLFTGYRVVVSHDEKSSGDGGGVSCPTT